jgi:hypothetical protein
LNLRKKPEDTVKFKCLARLEQWMSWGYVIDYDDVSGLGKHLNLWTGRWTMHTKKGKRDLIAWFRIGKTLWTYLIECKSETGHQSPAQIKYEGRWKGLRNVIYEVVSHPSQIDLTLDHWTGRTEKLLDEGTRHMGLK